MQSSTTVLQYQVLQYYSTTVLQCYSATVLQYYSTTVLQYYSTTVLQYQVLHYQVLQYYIVPYRVTHKEWDYYDDPKLLTFLRRNCIYKKDDS